jgi:hypothetical protein
MKQQMLEAEVKELRARIEALTAERDEAICGNHRSNEYEPTWAELTGAWKARAEAAEADNARLLGLIYDVVCGRKMFGLSADDDLKWATQRLGSALTGKETK